MKIGLYFTLGDLGLENTLAILQGALQAGVDLLELGLPFSDPLLDGVVIQQSHVRAVAQNIPWMQLCKGIELLKNCCLPSQKISLMTSAQHLYDSHRVRQLPLVDGILVTDIKHNLPCSFFLPSQRVWFLSQDNVLDENFTSPPELISMVYLARLQGTTGENQTAQSTTAAAIKRLRQVTEKNIWLGFGMSSYEDILRAQEQGAHGAIIGSAFVNQVTTYFFKNLKDKSALEQSRLLKEFTVNYVLSLKTCSH